MPLIDHSAKRTTSQRMRRALCVTVVAFALLGMVWAVVTPSLTSAQLKVYENVTRQLIAPCCWQEPIAIHRSEVALRMLDEVERFAAEGRSEEEIKAIYVARHGERILSDPTGAKRRWLNMVPAVLFCVLVIAAVLRLRSLRKRGQPAKSAAPPEVIARVRIETDNE